MSNHFLDRLMELVLVITALICLIPLQWAVDAGVISWGWLTNISKQGRSKLRNGWQSFVFLYPKR